MKLNFVLFTILHLCVFSMNVQAKSNAEPTNKTVAMFSFPYEVKTLSGEFDEISPEVPNGKEKKFPYLEDGYEMLLLSEFGGEVCVFSSNYDEETYINTLYIQSLDIKTLALGQRKSIFTTKAENINGAIHFCFLLKVSPNKEKLLVIERFNTGMGKVNVLNSDLIIEWSRENVGLFGFSDNAYLVTDEGEFFSLFQSVPETEKRKIEAYPYVLLHCSKDSIQLFEGILQIKDRQHMDWYSSNYPQHGKEDIHIGIDPKGRLVISGLYSTDGYGQNAIFQKVVDPNTLEVFSEEYVSFTEEMFLKNRGLPTKVSVMSEKERKTSEYKMEYFIESVIFGPDGSIGVVAEQSHWSRVSGSSNSYSTFSFEDIPDSEKAIGFDNTLIAQFGTDGKLMWQQVIPKNQSEWGSFYGYRVGCYTRFNSSGKLTVLYNDNIKNREYNLKKVLWGWGYGTPKLSKTDVALFTFGTNGEYEKSYNPANIPLNVYIYPSIYFEGKDGVIYILVQKEEERSFVPLTY